MTRITDIDLSHLIGREVGTATLLKELDRGAMAVVFVAYQHTLKRQIAVKVLPRSVLTQAMADLFIQEAELAAGLSHPNIIQVYEVGDTDEFLYFTMQLVAGHSMAHRIARVREHVIPSRRFLTVRETVETMRSVLDALDYAHGQDIVHRDVKPSNVLMEAHTRRPILMDFGISKSLRDPGADGEHILGTPVNMAPEQLLGRDADGRVDVYGAGMLLFQMLVSDLPLAAHATTKELLKLKLSDRLLTRRPSEVNPAVHPDMDAIIARATALDPENRYADCRQFADALKQYAAQYLPPAD
ncbi:MAG: serine/threonine-protein kinase [Thermodesulfobacteriota bacterium]